MLTFNFKWQNSQFYYKTLTWHWGMCVYVQPKEQVLESRHKVTHVCE